MSRLYDIEEKPDLERKEGCGTESWPDLIILGMRDRNSYIQCPLEILIHRFFLFPKMNIELLRPKIYGLS